MKIQESAENYLETILILKQRNGRVRAIDIVNELNFTKPSVSIALKNLRENGYVIVGENSFIELTAKGHEIAAKTYEKHSIIANCLMKIGVSRKQALEDACKMEHDISEETFLALKNFSKKI